jgi:hypothetical protein
MGRLEGTVVVSPISTKPTTTKRTFLLFFLARDVCGLHPVAVFVAHLRGSPPHLKLQTCAHNV